MYNSKLFAILEQFDKYEQNRCRKYIQSPYFNRSEQLEQLYERLLKETMMCVSGSIARIC